MQSPLLLFDIGNTALKIGLGTESEVVTSYTLRTATAQTADDFGLKLLTLLSHAGVGREQIRACVVSSVVPDMVPLLYEAVARYLGCPVLCVGNELDVPLKNLYEHPLEVGNDRLVAAYAARELFPQTPSLLVADFGTALTIDCVRHNAYLGGLIFPGPRTALAALSSKAAKLPVVDLEVHEVEPMPCRNTVTSMRHGLVFGFACLVEGLMARLQRQMPKPSLVLGTGGFASTIAMVSPVFDHVLPMLLLEGLRRLYYKNNT